MKKTVLLTLLSLCGASLCAMEAYVSQNERSLFEKALEDDVKANEFADYIASNFIDIDVILYSGRFSIGNHLSFCLSLENGKFFRTTPPTFETEKTRRIKKIIYPKVQHYRSNPPGVKKLRSHIMAALQDDAKIVDLAAFLKGKCFNIDLIAYETAFSLTTIAQMLDFMTHKPTLAAKIQRILELPEIKKFRSDKEATARVLFKAFEKDPIHLRDFEVSLKKFSLDVDSITYDPFHTVGDMIDDLVSKASVEDAVHDLAWLVRPYRSTKMRDFRNLLKAYESDTTKFESLKTWFTKNPFDVDGVAHNPSHAQDGSIGAHIDALKKEIKGPIAEVVRPYRAVEMKIFRDLFQNYEIDFIKTEELKKLKEWFEEHPFDIDVVAYDPSKPRGVTIGDKVNVLKDTGLKNIFNAKRSKPLTPSNLSKVSWLSGRNIALAAAVITTFCLYLWHKSRSKTDTTEDEDDMRSAVAQN